MSRARASLLAVVTACGGPGAIDGAEQTTAVTSGEEPDPTSESETGDAPARDVAPGDGTAVVDDTGADTTGEPPWAWSLPPGFRPPRVPSDNPMSAAKVELGRHLFYDTRLSSTGTYACATCHVQALAFTDGRTTSVGESGQLHRRNAMSLANVAYDTSLTWAHDALGGLEPQAMTPLFGDDPIELGLASEAELVAALAAEPRYTALFADAFPDDAAPMTAANVTFALASFERTIVSGSSPFDEWFFGESYGELSVAAIRGWNIFVTPPANCFRCHAGFNLNDASRFEDAPELPATMHNIGLYDVDGAGAYPTLDQGLVEVTGDPDDMGRFKVPTLRNVAVTAPYMHDGSVVTLSEVIDLYAAGGRTIDAGPNAGVGSESPLRSPFIEGFAITPEERADLLAFLESLTDAQFLTDPALGDPWTR